jgi:hypothetical protein
MYSTISHTSRKQRSAVAYEVILKGRPYKIAIAKRAAAEELKGCTGIHFGHYVADVSIKVI